ncbi:MAG: hypothetical protein IPO19_03005 [Rhodoferax sp.]|nr:hypothetical protein [Rhodoferax sp.]
MDRNTHQTGAQPNATPAAAGSAPALCPHLAPALDALLRQSARVLAATPMAWSKIDLEVVLDSGPPLAELPAHLLANAVQTWTNTDAHYPLAQGLVCRACRHSLGWPLHSPQAS